MEWILMFAAFGCMFLLPVIVWWLGKQLDVFDAWCRRRWERRQIQRVLNRHTQNAYRGRVG